MTADHPILCAYILVLVCACVCVTIQVRVGITYMYIISAKRKLKIIKGNKDNNRNYGKLLCYVVDISSTGQKLYYNVCFILNCLHLQIYIIYIYRWYKNVHNFLCFVLFWFAFEIINYSGAVYRWFVYNTQAYILYLNVACILYNWGIY